MPTQAQVQNIILSAQLRKATLLQENLLALNGGFNLPNSFYDIRVLSLYTRSVLRQYTMGDYVSPNFLVVYDCLCKQLGSNVSGATVDPNFQAPNTTVIVSPSNNVVFLNKTAANLLYDSIADAYYLPFLDNSGNGLPLGSVPVSVVDNGVQQEPALTTAYTPQRIYGFANAVGPQAIVVTVLIPSV